MLWWIGVHFKNLQSIIKIHDHSKLTSLLTVCIEIQGRGERHLNKLTITANLTLSGIVGNSIHVKTVCCIIGNMEKCDRRILLWGIEGMRREWLPCKRIGDIFVGGTLAHHVIRHIQLKLYQITSPTILISSNLHSFYQYCLLFI